MIDKGIVRGSEAQAKPLVVGLDTVYVHTDIRQITTEDGGVLYEYHEVQYTLAEFMTLVSERTDKNTKDIKDSTNTVDMVLTEVTPTLEEMIVKNTDTIDTLMTEILPLLFGEVEE